MAAITDEDIGVLELNDNFYRDGFGRVIASIIGILIAIFLLLAIAIYLYYTKPTPTTFYVGREFRVQGDVPVNQPYPSDPDMLQWVGENLPKAFVFDFYHYDQQLEAAQIYFTAAGWQVFLNQLNNYVNANTVKNNKLFVTARAGGAPYILNQNLLNGRYAWWVQMPILIDYNSFTTPSSRTLTLQVLVVRISTLNNLNGIAIENVIVPSSTE